MFYRFDLSQYTVSVSESLAINAHITEVCETVKEKSSACVI